MDKDQIWQEALDILLADVEPDDPKGAFLEMLKPFGIFGDQFVLVTGSERVENWVKKNYLGAIRAAVMAVTDTDYAINVTSAQMGGAQPAQPAETPAQQPRQKETPTFSVPSFIDQEPQEQPVQPARNDQPDWMSAYDPQNDDANAGRVHFTPTPAAEKPKSTSYAERREATRSGNAALFSKCTFDTFVVGKSNQFARGAALAVAEQPGVAYNPLFIYGNSGLGKTHLLVAIANYISQNYVNMAICYVSANEFLNDYVGATQRNQWGDFNAKYHNVDVLLVDDIQYLEGKDETINQLFNIFNEMTNQNKQIVLSADRAPKDIDMDERMRSRFISGLLADVKPPDYETRLAIIKNSYSRMHQTSMFFGEIPDEVLNYLAESSTSNIREMEGAITRLTGNMALCNKPTITIEEAQEVLQDFFPDIAKKQVTIQTIQSEVERFFEVSHEDLISSKRSKTLTYPRHIAIYLSRYMTDESLEAIGKKFGGRDHTTVMHSVNKVEQGQQDNRIMFDQIEQLMTRIKERS